jgi:serine/tyrosine/threonine adenylyltransferase
MQMTQSDVNVSSGWKLEHSYAQLPKVFHTPVAPTRVTHPRLVVLNHALAEWLGLDASALDTETGAEIFAGNRLPPGAAPLAQAYAGHQFGYFTTLGDGRAILLGEQITPRGERFDIQLKGSGPTPYSRRGDGRAALGPMLREYLISEAMHALCIPTTRSLAVAATGEEVWRRDTHPGAVLTRVAASHIRVGTFEWARRRAEESEFRALLDYTVQRHYPHLREQENLALALLRGVVDRQASLIAQWMQVGFVHGVMNTDNMALSGETIDYGPCAFIDSYDPSTVFSSIDEHGRYAFGNQPVIAQWNLARLAETLLPFIHSDEKQAISLATDAVNEFGDKFQTHWLAGMRRKLGLVTSESDDLQLIAKLLPILQKTGADFTNTFAGLAKDAENSGKCEMAPEFAEWHAAWRDRLARQQEHAEESLRLRRCSNPAFIPRNHRVEEALAAAESGDLAPFRRLLEILSEPYDHDRSAPEYQQPGPTDGPRYQTFCGT